MKRKVLILTAAMLAVLLLGGCDGGVVLAPDEIDGTNEASGFGLDDELRTPDSAYSELTLPPLTPAEETTTHATTTQATTTTAPTTTTAATTTAPKIYSLLDTEDEEMRKIDLVSHYSNALAFNGYLSDMKILSETTASAPMKNVKVARANDSRIYLSGESAEFESNNLQLVSSFKTAYNIKWNDTVFELEHKNEWSIKDTIMSYSLDELNINAFVGKDGNTYTAVIDPSYMMGLPLMDSSTTKKYNTYSMNDVDLRADTLCLNITSDETGLSELPNGYFYAKVKLKDITVGYSEKNGYSTECTLVSSEKISSDILNVIKRPYTLPDDKTKNPEMSAVYNTLIKNIDTIYNNDTNGINLMDMDFDGTPELFVSHNKNDSFIYSDIDIYRIKGGKLIFIDTLYNSTLPEDYENTIYRNSEKNVWYHVSYRDRAKEYTKTTVEVEDFDKVLYEVSLSGDKLNFKEIVKLNPVVNENGVITDMELRYLGEKANIVITKENYGGYDSPGVSYLYRCGDYSSYSIVGLESTITESYLGHYSVNAYDLYSSFICNRTTNIWSDNGKKLHHDIRTLSYKLAYITDAFYLGEYNINSKQNYYDFEGAYAKPVIYLYPEITTDISVKVTLTDGELTTTYPDYRDGWSVTAEPDGTLTDKADGRKHDYLYWEGEGYGKWDFLSGFCVQKDELITFLQEKLSALGLNDSEANEFIVYWLPLMQKNEYNIVSFQTTAYENAAKLDVYPAPDSELRVFMTFMAAEEKTDIPEQKLDRFERRGFCVVEWGGMECTVEEN